MEQKKSESGEPTQLGDDEALGLGFLLFGCLIAFIWVGTFVIGLIERLWGKL